MKNISVKTLLDRLEAKITSAITRTMMPEGIDFENISQDRKVLHSDLHKAVQDVFDQFRNVLHI
jgi:hypothetical protein